MYPARDLPCAFCGNEQTKLDMLGNFLWCPYCKHETPVRGDAELKQNLQRAEYLWPDWGEENFEGVGEHPNFIDPRHVPTFGPTRQGAWTFEASKIDWLMSRPDKFKDTREGQSYLGWMQANPQYDPLFPWMWSQARKGQIYVDPSSGQPHMTETHGEPNMESLNNYYNAYQQEYGASPHWMEYSPEDFSVDHNTFVGTPRNEWGEEYKRLHDQLKFQGTGQVGKQNYPFWDSWHDPVDPIDQPMLDRWAAFAKDKQHPIRQEAGNIDELAPNDFENFAKKWHFEKNNSQPIFNYNNGWSIRQLTNPQECRYEGEKMGHCAGNYGPEIENGRTLVYSLRDKQNRPHVTFEIRPGFTNHQGPTVDIDRLEGTMPPEQHEEFWRNYGMDPNRVREINHSLLGGDTKSPFADAAEGTAYRGLARSFPGEYSPKLPHEGTVEQIQGKEIQGGHEGVNTTPLPKYQKMLKHFFQTHFDDNNRPNWDDVHLNDVDDLNRHHSDDDDDGWVKYHPGDYGLNEPYINTDYDTIADEIANKGSGGGYNGYSAIDDGDVELLARHAIDQGEESEAQREIANHTERAEQEVRENLYSRVSDAMEDWDEQYPEPTLEDFPEKDEDGYPTDDLDEETFDTAHAKWERDREEVEQENMDSEFDEAWEENPWNQLQNTFFDEAHRYKRELARKANPWHQRLRDAIPPTDPNLPVNQKQEFTPEAARNVFMDAKGEGSVQRLRDALFDIPQNQWHSGHHSLMYHVRDHLEGQ